MSIVFDIFEEGKPTKRLPVFKMDSVPQINNRIWMHGNEYEVFGVTYHPGSSSEVYVALRLIK